MTEFSKLGELAARNPFFLGSVIESVASRDGLSDDALADRLGCAGINLARLRMCRAPNADAPTFADEVRRISDYCCADFAGLISIIKDWQISSAVRDASTAHDSGWLMAARDREPEDE
jgi:5-methylthioribose kinase